MNRRYFYYILAFTLLSLLLILIFFIGRPKPVVAQDIQTETPPFLSYISGTGIVEPVSGNINITAPFNRIIKKINVAVNDQVKKGDILFQLNDQELQANLRVRQKKYKGALANLQRLESIPREEDLTIAQEAFNKAQASFNESIMDYCMARSCANKQMRCKLWYKYQQAEAEFFAAQAQYEKVRSGTWQPDLKMARFEVEQAKANIEALDAEVDQTYIKSPIDGTVLQIKIHEGEIIDSSKIALILGNIEELNLRVSIDQFNEPRFHPDCPAVAFKQGDITTEFPLEFIHIEPFMIPKKYLTNELHERVDTQIFEILYRIEKNDATLFVGEQMDVYIYVDKEEENLTNEENISN